MYSHVLMLYSSKKLKSTKYSNCTHMREGQKRINVYLPDNLYSSVLNSEYKDITTAVIKGLEKLLEPPREDFEQVHTNTQESSNSLQNELIMSLKNHIASLESQIRVKDEQLRTQAVHLQTVLTQKAIGAGSTQKEGKRKDSRYREKEERVYEAVQDESPTIKESLDIEPEVKPEVFQEENTKEMTCLNCGKVFTASRSTRLYCSGACKTAYNRSK